MVIAARFFPLSFSANISARFFPPFLIGLRRVSTCCSPVLPFVHCFLIWFVYSGLPARYSLVSDWPNVSIQRLSSPSVDSPFLRFICCSYALFCFSFAGLLFSSFSTGFFLWFPFSVVCPVSRPDCFLFLGQSINSISTCCFSFLDWSSAACRTAAAAAAAAAFSLGDRSIALIVARLIVA